MKVVAKIRRSQLTTAQNANARQLSLVTRSPGYQFRYTITVEINGDSQLLRDFIRNGGLEKALKKYGVCVPKIPCTITAEISSTSTAVSNGDTTTIKRQDSTAGATSSTTSTSTQYAPTVATVTIPTIVTATTAAASTTGSPRRCAA